MHSPVNTAHSRRRHATGGDGNDARGTLENSSSVGDLTAEISEHDNEPQRHIGLMKSASVVSYEKGVQETNCNFAGEDGKSEEAVETTNSGGASPARLFFYLFIYLFFFLNYVLNLA